MRGRLDRRCLTKPEPRRRYRVGTVRPAVPVPPIAVHRLKPVIDKIFSFDQAKQAFAHMESGAHFGKVAIAIG